jgi:CDP-glucose 4,6-dehydratase
VNGHHFWHGRNVLVTGAGGFVASWICEALVGLGANVVGIVRDSTAERSLRLHGIDDRVNLVHGSIVDYVLVERAINEHDVDTCFHIAAQPLVGVANRSPLSTFESNIRGTWNVLEACRLSKTITRVVVASSDKAYGDQPVLPYREDTSLLGRYPYDASKVCTDVLARSYAATFDLPVAVTRCANIYGGADFNWSRLIPGTIRSILSGDEPVIRSDGTPERDYLYIADAVDAYLTLAQHAHEEGVRGGAFNFGSNCPVSALNLVEHILAAAGSSLRPRVLGQAKGEIDRQFLDSSLARQRLGWEPRVGLPEGLRHSINWYARYLGIPAPAAVEVGGR